MIQVRKTFVSEYGRYHFPTKYFNDRDFKDVVGDYLEDYNLEDIGNGVVTLTKKETMEEPYVDKNAHIFVTIIRLED